MSESDAQQLAPLTSIRMRYVVTPDRQRHSVSGAVLDRLTVVGGEFG
jgi:hypothetical protein